MIVNDYNDSVFVCIRPGNVCVYAGGVRCSGWRLGGRGGGGGRVPAT